MSTHKINNVVTNYDVKNKIGKVGYAYFGALPAQIEQGLIATESLTNKTVLAAALVGTGKVSHPRCVRIAVVDTTASITAGLVTINGLDINGNSITDKIAFTGAATKLSPKIFSYVSSIVISGFTALGGSGDETITIGWGNYFGLPLAVGHELVAVKEALQGGTHNAPTAVDIANKSILFGTSPNGTIVYAVRYEYQD